MRSARYLGNTFCMLCSKGGRAAVGCTAWWEEEHQLHLAVAPELNALCLMSISAASPKPIWSSIKLKKIKTGELQLLFYSCWWSMLSEAWHTMILWWSSNSDDDDEAVVVEEGDDAYRICTLPICFLNTSIKELRIGQRKVEVIITKKYLVEITVKLRGVGCYHLIL